MDALSRRGGMDALSRGGWMDALRRGCMNALIRGC